MAGKQQAERVTYRIDWENNECTVIETSPLLASLSRDPFVISPFLHALRAMVGDEPCTGQDERLFLADMHCRGNTMTVSLRRNDYSHVAQAPQEVLEWLLRRTLTPRETQVAAMLFEGGTIRSIASQLCIAEGTVKRIIYNIYQKCNVGSQVDLIREIYKRLAQAQSLICPIEWNPGD